MSAPVGNQFWKVRAKDGKDKIFADPESLWTAATEYFQWIDDNPLSEEKIFSYQGDIVHGTVSHIRAMTLESLYLFLGIGRRTWRDYKAREDYTPIIEDIESVIRSQKFAGAAADLLNANIIARDLGLRDAKEITGPDGGPMHVIGTEMSQDEATALYKQIIDD